MRERPEYAEPYETGQPNSSASETTSGLGPAQFPDRHLRFAMAYLGHGNASRAAREAGYAERNAHVQGHHLLRNPKIRSFLKAKGVEVAEELNVTAEKILTQMASIAFSSMDHFLTFDADGQPTIDVSRASPEQMSAIAHLEIKEIAERALTTEGELVRRKVRVTRMRLHPPERALEKLGRQLFAMFVDNGRGQGDVADAVAEIAAMVQQNGSALPVGEDCLYNRALRSAEPTNKGTREPRDRSTNRLGTMVLENATAGRATGADSDPTARFEDRCPYCRRQLRFAPARGKERTAVLATRER